MSITISGKAIFSKKAGKKLEDHVPVIFFHLLFRTGIFFRSYIKCIEPF